MEKDIKDKHIAGTVDTTAMNLKDTSRSADSHNVKIVVFSCNLGLKKPLAGQSWTNTIVYL